MSGGGEGGGPQTAILPLSSEEQEEEEEEGSLKEFSSKSLLSAPCPLSCCHLDHQTKYFDNNAVVPVSCDIPHFIVCVFSLHPSSIPLDSSQCE